jgi:hypothetical protein
MAEPVVVLADVLFQIGKEATRGVTLDAIEQLALLGRLRKAPHQLKVSEAHARGGFKPLAKPRVGGQFIEQILGVRAHAFVTIGAGGAWRSLKFRTRCQGVQVADDSGEGVGEHRADPQRRLHALDLDAAEHVDVLAAEAIRPLNNVDGLTLVGALVEEMPDVFAVGLVGDPA